MTELSRREFLTALGGAALLLRVPAEPGGPLEPNQWLRVDASGEVTIVAARSEMGQGVRTALPMIVAAELGADWTRVRVTHARPGPRFREMRTSGSGSVSGSWRPLRVAAAAAREMLTAAAAAEWGVAPESCRAEQGEIVHAASGRRVTFGGVAARASRLPVPTAPALRPDGELALLGASVPRVDAELIVSGRAVYGVDARPEGVPVAVVARPPQHGASVAEFDDSAARRVPGVTNVVRVPTGVAVIATDTWAAMRGRDALRVTWRERQAPNDDSAAYLRALEGALERGKVARREGDAARALASAARRMEATYVAPFQAHAALEPLSCVADVRDGRCELRVGTQAPNEVQGEAAKLLGIPADAVRVDVPLLGGAFGRRLDVGFALEAVEVSRAARTPVQVVWTREDDTRHDMYQAAQVNRLEAALDARGVPVAWRHRVADYHLTMFGPYDPNYDPAADGDPWGAFDTPYAFPAIDVTLALLPSPVPTGAWRAVTYPAAVFARESFVDEVAAATKRDPLALRLALLPSPGAARRGALTLPNGDRLRAVLRLAAERAGWGTPLAAAGGRRWGRGVACNAYHRGTMVAQVAEVSVGAEGDVRVHRVVCAVDCGRVINRSGLDAQFEGGVAWALSALRAQATFANGRTVEGNFHDFPVLRFDEMPAVEVHAVASALPPFGVGEPPVPAVWPAVTNAIFAATGVRVRRLPLDAGALRWGP